MQIAPRARLSGGRSAPCPQVFRKLLE